MHYPKLDTDITHAVQKLTLGQLRLPIPSSMKGNATYTLLYRANFSRLCIAVDGHPSSSFCKIAMRALPLSTVEMKLPPRTTQSGF